MDYSDRVNSKKGAGGIASKEDANISTKRRVKELLATHVLDLDNDPYVFRNHVGLLECKLCLTTHNNEASYISHLGGRKHHLNLERRRILDERQRKQQQHEQKIGEQLSISRVEKRSWKKIGQPEFKVVKIQHPETLKLGFLVSAKFPNIVATNEPLHRFMSYFELSSRNQNSIAKYVASKIPPSEDLNEKEEHENQVLVISAEPYENIAIVLPNDLEIDKPQDEGTMSDTFWWFWDNDTKEYILQLFFK
ncbi:CWF complex protein sap62 [Lodderomyces elongisporus]|uniref:CWF complex protein sap62 n=1 Tax=Lodderomyces elongisporus TaxID=36914 RepID=UPI0029247564|nr:CWF complex protein sap62 [Lodderomyces elongisporus]WLF76834.1 CWF complex protein sap62 [Lodderomyces elongisporus]